MGIKFIIRERLFDFKQRCQRFRRGYADVDVWNFYAWFLDITPKMLQQLNEGRVGHPCDLTDKQWDAAMKKMIECFTEANEDTCTKVNKYAEEYSQSFRDIKFPYDLKKDIALTKKYQKEEEKLAAYRDKKLHQGLELFDKHFWNLWD